MRPTHSIRPTPARRLPKRVRAARRAGLALGLLVFLACASRDPDERALPQDIDPAQRIPSNATAPRTADGLVRVNAPDIAGSFYVRPPRPHLQRYEKMVLAPTEIEYKPGAVEKSRRQEARLRVDFEGKLLDTIQSGQFWTLADEIDASTLIVRASIRELDVARPIAPADSSSTTIMNASGGAVIGFELLDGPSGQPLLRYVERSRLPGGVYSGTDVDSQRLKRVLHRFAGQIGGILRFQYRVIREIERREQEGGSG